MNVRLVVAIVGATRAALSANAEKGTSSPQPDLAAPGGCRAPPPGTTGPALSTVAVLAGQHVTVDVYATPDGGDVLVVRDATTCAEVFSQRL